MNQLTEDSKSETAFVFIRFTGVMRTPATKDNPADPGYFPGIRLSSVLVAELARRATNCIAAWVNGYAVLFEVPFEDSGRHLFSVTGSLSQAGLEFNENMNFWPCKPMSGPLLPLVESEIDDGVERKKQAARSNAANIFPDIWK